MAVTLKDIADAVGVSPNVVSHVLNPRSANVRVGAATAERVRRTAADLGYRPNRLARSLGRGRTDTLALLVSGLTNPFFVEVMEETERAALDAGYQVLLDAAPSVGGTYFRHARFGDWPVDGALVWANADQTAEPFLGPRTHQVPVVYLGYPRSDGQDWVAFDLANGARQATRYLLDKGLRPAFATVYPEAKVEVEPRFRAYAEEVRGTGMEPWLVTTGDEEETRAAGFALAERWLALAEPPRALLCHNDVLAISLTNALLRRGVDVGREVAVVGFDGIEEGRYGARPLTTVRTDPAALARAALNLLLRRLKGDDDSPGSVSLPCHLWRGETA